MDDDLSSRDAKKATQLITPIGENPFYIGPDKEPVD
jgi:hypothetical protein